MDKVTFAALQHLMVEVVAEADIRKGSHLDKDIDTACAWMDEYEAIF